MSGAEIRVLLYAESCFDPNPKKRVLLPFKSMCKNLHISRTTLGNAIKALCDLGLLNCTKIGKRPLRPGGAGPGEAAEYDIPHRHSGSTIELEPSDRRYRGFWRIYCHSLRSTVMKLSDPAAKIWACILVPCDRDRYGRPEENQPIALSGRTLAVRIPKMSASTASRAIIELLKLGLIEEAEAQNGSRPAMYKRSGATVAARSISKKRLQQASNHESKS